MPERVVALFDDLVVELSAFWVLLELEVLGAVVAFVLLFVAELLFALLVVVVAAFVLFVVVAALAVLLVAVAAVLLAVAAAALLKVVREPNEEADVLLSAREDVVAILLVEL